MPVGEGTGALTNNTLEVYTINLKTYLKMLVLVFIPLMALIVLGAVIVSHFELSDLVSAVIAVVYAVVLAPIVINWIKFLVDKDIL